MLNMEAKKAGLIYNMPSGEYHSMADSFSSSQLKTMLEDAEIFYRTYITKELGKESVDAFDVGTYFHTWVLEPHKLDEECIVYDGVRRGAAWEKFSKEHGGKAIISPANFEVVKKIVEATKSSPRAMELIQKGKPEVSAFLEVIVNTKYGIIITKDQTLMLGKDGWVPNKTEMTGVPLLLKARADLLGDGYILDLKSTQGNTKNTALMKKKISEYNYDLSAALYLDIFTATSGEIFDKFYWTFSSKDKFNSKTYLASVENIQVGRAKWKYAAIKLAECIEAGWKFEDSIEVLEPNYWEQNWIKEPEVDFL